MSNPYYYRRRDDYQPPRDTRFRMRVGVTSYIVVTTGPFGVSMSYFDKYAHSKSDEPDWVMHLDFVDNPHLWGLRDPALGWDLIGLARLLWAYVVNPNQVELTAGQRREPDDTVSEQFHREHDIQQRRETAETEALIREALQHSVRPVTRLELAKVLGLSKSPRLIGIIEGMVDRGELKRAEVELKNGKSTFLYTKVNTTS